MSIALVTGVGGKLFAWLDFWVMNAAIHMRTVAQRVHSTV